MPFFLAGATILRGWALAIQGQVEEGIAEIYRGLEIYRSVGVRWGRSYYLGLLAEAYGNGQQWEKGLNAVAEGLTAAEKAGERWHESELYRLKGELTLQRLRGANPISLTVASQFQSPALPGIQAEAQALFNKAIEVARHQSAKSLELRAVISLSRLWQDQGKLNEAYGLLAEIYRWFTEGFDTADLKDAKALLDELRT